MISIIAIIVTALSLISVGLLTITFGLVDQDRVTVIIGAVAMGIGVLILLALGVLGLSVSLGVLTYTG